MLWTDNMMIPKHAKNPYNAHLWMNYYYQPNIAALVEDWVNYICPVNGAADVLKKGDPSIGLVGDPKVAGQPADLPAQVDAGQGARVQVAVRETKRPSSTHLFADLTGTA